MAKQLIRTVIIREYDYKKLYLRYAIGTGHGLYTSATFDPYLRTSLEQDYVIRALKNTLTEFQKSHPPPGTVHQQLMGVRDSLYNVRYLDYQITEDADGQIWCQSRSSTPRTRLGLATFTYIY